ncbi:MAG TPA: biotin carboxylase N-terminal domain-containing protein [Nocardioidaceae bacterium]
MVPTSATNTQRGPAGINRLLVANRGEIARRVFRTCRDLGIETVAVFSDADADLPFVTEADVAVRLPGSTPAETYLRGDLVVEAARRAGADAVHPGYGFLSENAAFARQVIDAGLTWVGPAPESIEAMGSKVEAKKLMEKAGVPVLGEISPASVTEDDLPLLVKASAGGGGRGMRVVRTLDAVPGQVELAANEAASAFGDPTVFCEPYVEHGRHVEVQVVGDTHGTVVVLGERDCSIQRRHQKVVEETPAPGLAEETRTAMHDAARAAAHAIGYIGAGTVEFLTSGDRFFFLEMNTRLQVEHPVTELVTGHDLVAMQIAVAEGRPLDATDVPHPHGHAIEVRLYAEDPASDWQPQSGRLTRFEVPGVSAAFENPAAYGIRLDSGFESGSEVGTHYDAMLAKVIAWAPTRDEAARRLVATLRRSRIHGLRTNRDLLVEVLDHPAFRAGDVRTYFLSEHPLPAMEGREVPGTATEQGLMFLAAAVAVTEEVAARRPVQQRIPTGWRNVVSAPQVTTFDFEGTEVPVGWYGGRDGYRSADPEGARVTSVLPVPGGRRIVVEHDGVSHPFDVFVVGDRVDVESVHGHLALTVVPRFTDPADQVAAGSLLAPMPGSVVSVGVSAGDAVAAGQTVLVLEAMKMQHTVSAPHDGVVTEIPVSVGEQVAAGAVLAVVQTEDAAAEGDSE